MAGRDGSREPRAESQEPRSAAGREAGLYKPGGRRRAVSSRERRRCRRRWQ
jgi:hypothetical protein